MKTVKDYIFNLDTKQLVDTFFAECGEKIYDIYSRNNIECEDDLHIEYDESIRDLSVFDYAQAERKQIYDLIKYLKDIDITECSNGKTGIIYAYSKYDMDIHRRWQARLLFKEDLIADIDTCENHSFITVPFSEVLGFHVADNKFTQYVIYEVIASVLECSTLTGYRQENNDKYIEAYKRHNKNKDFVLYEAINEDSLYFINENLNEINYNETVESQKRLIDVRKAIREYELFTMRREREILLKALK